MAKKGLQWLQGSRRPYWHRCRDHHSKCLNKMSQSSSGTALPSAELTQGSESFFQYCWVQQMATWGAALSGALHWAGAQVQRWEVAADPCWMHLIMGNWVPKHPSFRSPPFLSFMVVLGFEFRGLWLTRQTLYYLSQASIPPLFALVVFSNRVSSFFWNWTYPQSSLWPPT
jgi:hypothetical protein